MAAMVLGLRRPFGDGLLALLAIGAVALAGYTVCVLPSRDFLRGADRGDRPHRDRHRASAPVRSPRQDMR
jgi:PST family polysaccharide transporter